MSVVNALRQKILQGASIGINQTLDAVLADLIANVPVKTGTLRGGFRIEQRATPENLSGRITNSVGYANEHYPYRLYSPNRYPNGYPAPSLFKPKASRVGILAPNEVDQSQIAELLQQTIQKQL